MNLFEIASQYSALLDRDEYSHLELEALDKLQDDMEAKAIAISHYILNLQAEVNAVNDRQKEMFDRAKRLDSKIDSLKEYLRNNLVQCKIDKITKCPDFIISIKTNPPSIHVDDEKKIPEDYFKREEVLKLDKKLIKEDIDKGIEVPGASLIRKTRLEIK